MLFSNDECKCLHIWQADANLMNKTELLSTETEDDVGVISMYVENYMQENQ